MGAPNANELEREYEAELEKANGGGGDDGPPTRVEVLPTLDGQGRLYDIGTGRDEPALLPGNKKKKEKVCTHCLITHLLAFITGCRSKPEIQKLVISFVSTLTMTTSRWANFYAKNDLVQAPQTRRTWTRNMLVPS